MSRTRVKICCITSLSEAALAINAGADAIGLITEMPSGPGVIDEADIRRIADAVSSDVEAFLLTSLTVPALIQAAMTSMLASNDRNKEAPWIDRACRILFPAAFVAIVLYAFVA